MLHRNLVLDAMNQRRRRTGRAAGAMIWRRRRTGRAAGAMIRRRRRTGRAAGALVVLAALPGLAACGPADRPLTAIRAVQGEPVILLAGCPDFDIDSVTVITESGNPTQAVDGPDRAWKRATPTAPTSLPLFGTPPTGWTVTDDRLTALAADRSYSLLANDDNTRSTVSVTFTAADLTALAPDEVLIGKRPSSHEKVTEREFRRRADKSC